MLTVKTSFMKRQVNKLRGMSCFQLHFKRRWWGGANNWLDLINDSHHLCRRLKAMASGFSGGQISDKICQYKKSRSCGNYGWKWSLLLFEMQYDRRSGVLIANNNNVKLVETRTEHFACLKLSNCFNRPRLLVLAIFNTCFPPEIPSDITFIPTILKRVQRWRVS